MMKQLLQRILLFIFGQCDAWLSVTSLMLLVCVLMGLPTLSGAQQSCQPDGDVDQNGSVAAADALLVFQQALGSAQLSACQQVIADVFPQPAAPDGSITASDALCIFQKALELPSCLDSVSLPNKAPVANAGSDQSVDAGVIVVLSGTASDPDGSIVSNMWEQTGGTMVSLAGADSLTAMFTAPDVSVDETLTFRLAVTDDDGAQVSDEVMVTVRRVNQSPTVAAGSDQSVDAGAMVSLAGAATATDMFTVPDVSADETVTFSHTVTADDDAQASEKFTSVSAGGSHTCGVRESGAVECWGLDKWGQSTPPAGTFTSVSAGYDHTCGVRESGAVACWGRDDSGQSTPPAGTFVLVSGGGSHTCGVRESGAVACWGRDSEGQSTAPAGTFISVSAGSWHTCGLRESGAVECWGHDDSGQSTTPAGTFVLVSGGNLHTCGVRDSGEVACWGADAWDLSTPPAGMFTSISAGSHHTCGVRESGAVACWGRDGEGAATPSARTFISVSAGGSHTCGLRESDAVECWGLDKWGQSTPPNRVNQPPMVNAGVDQSVEAGTEVILTGTASDPDGTIVSYLWEQTDGTTVSLSGDINPTTAVFTAPDVTITETLTFQFIVTDGDGATGHDAVSVTVMRGAKGADGSPDPTIGFPVSPGTISGTLRVGDGSVLDSDAKDEIDPVVENNSLQGQSLGLTLPVTVAGHVNNLDDKVDVYRITLPELTGIGLKIGDWPAADLDLYLADTNGEIIDASIGGGRFEAIGIGYGLQEEFLVMVHASSGASNYILSFGIYDPWTFSQVSGAGLRPDTEFVPNEVIVEFKERHDALQGDALLAAVMGGIEFGIELTAKAVSPSGPILLGFQSSAEAQLHSEPDDGGIGPLHYATPEAAEKAKMLHTIKRLGFNPALSYAEPNFISHALLIPDDPRYSDQWHYPLIHLPEAWNITTGSDDIIVAVIDSGIKPYHGDLSSRLLGGYDFIRDPDRAKDGDGIDSDPTEPSGLKTGDHGSHVAGTIGAVSNNGLGVAGVTWRGDIMPLRVLGEYRGEVSGTAYDIAQAILYAAGLPNRSGSIPFRRADIINLSLGPDNDNCSLLPSVSQTQRRAIEQALDAGVHVVVAAGNDDCGVPAPMSTIDGVITVSAVDTNGEKAGFSNYGRTIDVAAPGVRVLSTVGDDSEYKRESGTSMAAPHVAGVLALMLSINPNLRPADIDQLLAGTHPWVSTGSITRDLGAPGRDDDYGHGLIDAYKAVQAARVVLRPGQPPILAVSPDSLNFGEYRTVAFTHVANVGAGELIIGSVTTDKPWLVVEDYDPFPTRNYPYVDVRVNRTGLREGGHIGHVSITSNGGDRTIPVTVTVRSSNSGGNAGTVYIMVVDPATLEPVAQAMTDAAQRYEYLTPEVPAGVYLVVAGTDRDDDGFICDPGEACGVWPAIDSWQPVLVDGDQTGIDIPVFSDLITGPGEPPLAEFLPTGIRRLPNPDFPATTQVSVGDDHTCMLRDTGTIECQGDNRYGQSTPPSGRFISVSAGYAHTCGIRETGAVECWGWGGQSTPPSGTFISVSAGYAHTCGVRDTGTVECWGSNHSSLRSRFPVYTGQATPPSGTFISVSAGYAHTCGVLRNPEQGELADMSSSNVECWGDDSHGQSTPPWGTFISLSAGTSHTCGIRETGAVECWGSDFSGESTPPSGTFISVSAGWSYTCGVRETGAVECWGSDFSGESTPPSGTFTSVSAGSDYTCGLRDTRAVECWGFNAPPAGTFTSVSAGSWQTCGIRETGAVECWGTISLGESPPPAGTFISVSAGDNHTCGIRETGAVECWGNRLYRESPPPSGKFTSVSAGSDYTCGIRGTGGVVCWGSLPFVIIGPGAPPPTPPAGTFISVSVSATNACAIQDSGTLRCWGGWFEDLSTPPAGTFTSISAGSDHICAVRDTGAVVCWGDDSHGQSTPPAGTFISVSAGDNHTCGIRETGAVECWGDDSYGQSTPPAGTFISVSAGYGNYTCGIRDTEAVVCWGSYVNGLRNSEF